MLEIFEKHPQWPEVLKICKTLRAHGYTAWLAGGCVRDLLLSVSPQDFDVVTNAVPDVVQKLFPDSLDIGKAFGIIMVPVQSGRIEIATFRSDGSYKDGRRPENVVFSTPQEDAERRDFTVNALFYDPENREIKDYVDGRKDLGAKILRAVGDPFKRFEEDKLRMLRVVRFAAQLGFEVEPKTKAAVTLMADQIQVISAERIYYELKRLMQTSRSSMGIQLLNDLGLLRAILKEVYNEEAIQSAVIILGAAETCSLEIKSTLFWLCFLNKGIEVELLKNKLREMKFSKDEFEVYFYVTDALRKIESGVLSLGESYELVFGKHGRSVLEVGKILWKDSESFSKVQKIEKLLNDFSELPRALVNGDDLIALGLKPSSQMKDILKRAYYYQLENKINDKPQMLSWTKKQIS